MRKNGVKCYMLRMPIEFPQFKASESRREVIAVAAESDRDQALQCSW